MIWSRTSNQTYRGHAGLPVTEITNLRLVEQLFAPQNTGCRRVQIDASRTVQSKIAIAIVDASSPVHYGARAPNREVKQQE
jgi:hypothetical protein